MAIPISDIYVRLGEQNAVTEIKFVQGGWLSTGSLADIEAIDATRVHDKQIAYSTEEGKFYIAAKTEQSSVFNPGPPPGVVVTPASLTWSELPIGFPYTGSAGISGSLAVVGPVTASIFSGSYVSPGSNGYILYNSGSNIHGTSSLFFDDVNNRVGIGTDTPTAALEVVGDAIITGILTAQEFHTEFVSASILYSSGSTKFGDTSDDIHSFSGSLQITGSGPHYFTDGNLGLGTTAAPVRLTVEGSISASGAIYDNSGSAGTSGQIIQSTETGYIWTDFNADQARDLVISGKNMTTSSIAKGTPLYFSGSNTSGNLVGVYPADAGNPDRMPAGGVAAQSLGSGSEGTVYIYGFINGVNTSAFTAGDDVFVAVGGGYTNVKPTGSALIQKLGNVEKVDATNGSGVIQGPSWYNDLPNWEEGKVMVGRSDGQPVTSSFTYYDETNNVLESTGSFDSTKDSIFYGVCVGRGGGEISTNTRVGACALSSNVTGTSNVAVGTNASLCNTVGTNTTAVGYSALRFNEASTSTAIGSCALRANTTGTWNTAVGFRAGRLITTGAFNTALGNQALDQNITGNNNTAVGLLALSCNTVSNNTAVGTRALSRNTTGTNNTAVGYLALCANTVARYNTAVGYKALVNNTTGERNVGLGHGALNLNTIGSRNIAVGFLTLQSNTTGNNNTAVGNLSMRCNTTGACNTALGHYTLINNTTGTLNVAIGASSQISNTYGTCNISIGADTLRQNTTGNKNVAIGHAALKNNTTGDVNLAVGAKALYHNTAHNNVALGHYAGSCTTTGTYNTALGICALRLNTTGANNTAVGFCAAINNTTGTCNTAVGRCALRSNTIGGLNTAIGDLALRSNTTGNQNVAVGQCALPSSTVGSYNVAVGRNALRASTTGGNNTALGFETLSSNTGGNFNTAIGRRALCANTTGVVNTAVGTGALSGITTGQYNVGLGGYAASSFSTGNCNMFISDGQGNLRMFVSSSGNVGIPTTSPSATLHVSGTVRLETYGEGDRTSNDIVYALGVDSSGNVLEIPQNTGANVDVDTGTEVVDQFLSGSVRAAFTNYYVLSGSNMRAGQLMSIWDDAGNIEYTDVSTNSIGDTSGVFMTSATSASYVQIKATVDSDNWSVKVNTSLL